MGKRNGADRRKQTNANAQARTRSTGQTQPPTRQAASGSSSLGAENSNPRATNAQPAHEMSGASGARQPIPQQTAAASQPQIADHDGHSAHAVTVATPEDERSATSDESLVRRFFLTDEAGNLVRPQRTVRERVDEWAGYLMPFSPRERDWGSPTQLRGRLLSIGAVVGALVVALVAGMLVFHWAQSAGSAVGNLPAPQPTQSAPGGIVVQANPNGAQPTPAFAPYLIGAWVSNTAPPSSSTIQVYVRVSTSSGPAANVPVTISVGYGGGANSQGPIHTNAYGLATFNVGTGKGDGTQVDFVTATAKINGKTYSAQTTFTPF